MGSEMCIRDSKKDCPNDEDHRYAAQSFGDLRRLHVTERGLCALLSEKVAKLKDLRRILSRRIKQLKALNPVGSQTPQRKTYGGMFGALATPSTANSAHQSPSPVSQIPSPPRPHSFPMLPLLPLQ